MKKTLIGVICLEIGLLTPLHLLVVFGHIVGPNGTQEPNVIV